MFSSTSIAVLTSGGLDSSILICDLLGRYSSVYPIYIRSGHLWEETELFWLRRYLSKIRNKKLKKLVALSLETRDLYRHHWSVTGQKVPGAKSNDRNVYLPGKNLLLIAKGAVYCSLRKIPNLALGPLKTNPFPDANASFFKMLEKACAQGLDFPIRIQTPFLRMTKNQVMKLGKKLPLDQTFSCISPVGKNHCGKCNKCAERKRAFRNAGIPDKTRYEH